MKDMLKRFKRWTAKKGLELNEKKTKIMLSKKKGGRRKDVTFRWNETVSEMVKSFDYLGYTLKGNIRTQNRYGRSRESRTGVY